MLKKKAILSEFIKHLADDPLVRVEEFDGVFALDARSDLFSRLILLNEYEPEIAKLCWKFIDPDRDVVDVGANVGFFSVLFAKAINGKKVLSVEPTPNAIRRLRRNLEINKVTEKVIVFEGVVSDINGMRILGTIEGKEEFSSLGAMEHPSIVDEKKVQIESPSKTLDQLVEENSLDPGFIKIDVEGAENMVFKGATKILQNSRPVIISELYDYLLKKNGTSAHEIVTMLTNLDYIVLDPLNNGVNPKKMRFGNILCIPKERI